MPNSVNIIYCSFDMFDVMRELSRYETLESGCNNPFFDKKIIPLIDCDNDLMWLIDDCGHLTQVSLNAPNPDLKC